MHQLHRSQSNLLRPPILPFLATTIIEIDSTTLQVLLCFLANVIALSLVVCPGICMNMFALDGKGLHTCFFILIASQSQCHSAQFLIDATRIAYILDHFHGHCRGTALLLLPVCTTVRQIQSTGGAASIRANQLQMGIGHCDLSPHRHLPSSQYDGSPCPGLVSGRVGGTEPLRKCVCIPSSSTSTRPSKRI